MERQVRRNVRGMEDIMEWITVLRRAIAYMEAHLLEEINAADVAEDLVQDAFVKVWQYIEDGGEIDNFTSFIYRSVRNVCLSYLRNRHETVTHRFATRGYGGRLMICRGNAVTCS